MWEVTKEEETGSTEVKIFGVAPFLLDRQSLSGYNVHGEILASYIKHIVQSGTFLWIHRNNMGMVGDIKLLFVAH